MLEDVCEVTLSINFNNSQDGDHSDCQFSPTKQSSFSVKCFRCFGSSFANGYKCAECHGDQWISSLHPMSLLLDSIINKKTARLNLDEKKDQRDYQKLVETIQEEEEESDDRKWVCNSSNNVESNNISSNALYCNFCLKTIQGCYSTCRTCQINLEAFNLCDSCADSNSSLHPDHHFLEPTILVTSSNQGMNIETISQQFSDEEKEEIYGGQNGGQNGEGEQSGENQRSESEVYIFELGKKNSSIQQYLSNSQDLDSIIKINYSHPKQTNQILPSIVRLQVDGLFSSVEISECLTPTTPTTLFPLKNITEKYHPRFSSHSEMPTTHNDYLFIDYECDICKISPIRNIRYHCATCQNFDICHSCFEHHSHHHSNFESIDGLQMKRQKQARVMQLLDHNKEVEEKNGRRSRRCATINPIFSSNRL